MPRVRSVYLDRVLIILKDKILESIFESIESGLNQAIVPVLRQVRMQLDNIMIVRFRLLVLLDLFYLVGHFEFSISESLGGSRVIEFRNGERSALLQIPDNTNYFNHD